MIANVEDLRKRCVDVERRAGKDLTDATRRASALLDTLEEPKNGPTRKRPRDVESEPHSRGVRDSVNRELWEQVIHQES